MRKVFFVTVLVLFVHVFPVRGQQPPTTLPSWITSPPRPLPIVKPVGNPQCTPYSQLPTAVLTATSPLSVKSNLNEAPLVVLYDDGRLSPIDPYIDCGRNEQVVASHYFEDSIRRDTIFSAVPPPHGVPWTNVPDCAYREYPVCSANTGPTCSLCSDPLVCGPDPGGCDPCEDQFGDNPPAGFPYTHTTMECAMPTGAKDNAEWHVIFTRTTYESFGCSGSFLEGCEERIRGLPASTAGFVLDEASMSGLGDIEGLPFCTRRGCCLGSGFHNLSLVPWPNPTNGSAWVFANALLDEPGLSGKLRLGYDFTTRALTGTYDWIQGLNPDHRLVDVAWSLVQVDPTTQVYRFWGLSYSGYEKRLYVYFSDDQGLTWSPYLVDDVHLRYGDGERTWLGGWLRNANGSLASPVMVLWTYRYDHDEDANTRDVETLFFETDGTTADFPASILEWIFWDGFETGDTGAWFAYDLPAEK